MKKAIKLIIVLSILLPLFASETEKVSIRIIESDKRVKWYRYSIDGGEWITDPLLGGSIVLPYEKGTMETVTIEASFDKDNWSESHTVLITPYDGYTVEWGWEDEDERVKWYRYRINDEKEITVPSSIKAIRWDVVSGESLSLSVSSSYDGNIWSEERRGELTAVKVPYKENKHTALELSLSAGTGFSIIDFYNGHGIEGANYLTVTKPGLSAGTEVRAGLTESLRGFLGFDYLNTDKKTTVIPDAFSVDYYIFQLGLDLLVPLSNRFSLYAGIGISPVIEVNANKWSNSLFFSVRLGMEYSLNERIRLGLKSRVGLSHYSTEDYLYRTMTYIVEPIALSVGVRL